MASEQKIIIKDLTSQQTVSVDQGSLNVWQRMKDNIKVMSTKNSSTFKLEIVASKRFNDL